MPTFRFKEHVDNHQPDELLTEEEYLELKAQVVSIPPGVTLSDEKETTDITAGPPGQYNLALLKSAFLIFNARYFHSMNLCSL